MAVPTMHLLHTALKHIQVTCTFCKEFQNFKKKKLKDFKKRTYCAASTKVPSKGSLNFLDLAHSWGVSLWRFSKAVWTWSWATCCRWPCLSRRIGPDDLQMSSNFSHSVILCLLMKRYTHLW